MVIAQSRRVFLGVRYVYRVCISVVYACNGCVFVYAYFGYGVYLHCLSYNLRFVEYISTVYAVSVWL